MKLQVGLMAALLIIMCGAVLGQRSYDVEVLAGSFHPEAELIRRHSPLRGGDACCMYYA